MFDAVSIEHAFASFLQEPIGERGRRWDADVFRLGSPADIAKAITLMARHIETRTHGLSWSPDEGAPGGSLARLQSAAKSLQRLATDMASRRKEEPEDYHWEIVGKLVLCLSDLFDHLEGKGQGH